MPPPPPPPPPRPTLFFLSYALLFTFFSPPVCFISLTSLKRGFWRRSGGKSATSTRLRKVGRRGGNTLIVWREGKSSASSLSTTSSPRLGNNFYLQPYVLLWRPHCFLIHLIYFNKPFAWTDCGRSQEVNIHFMISYGWDKRPFHLLISGVYQVSFLFWGGRSFSGSQEIRSNRSFSFGIKKGQRAELWELSRLAKPRRSRKSFSREWGFTELDAKLTDIWGDSMAKYLKKCGDRVLLAVKTPIYLLANGA